MSNKLMKKEDYTSALVEGKIISHKYLYFQIHGFNFMSYFPCGQP